ncbi:S1C family serine protease [Haladaptatus cibarius]|uniref:S1C family serine protease n=1 Tax=Haladaptatus cibarius TaxID=453847 RepID=UPI0006799AAE|nr:trypsin-like peptidase domain-containing protein [Haladaptatus cibarius]
MTHRLFVTVLVLMLAVGAVPAHLGTATQSGTATATQAQDGCNYAQLYDRTIDSVVSIRVGTAGGQFGQGSGFVYRSGANGTANDTGLIVTNNHVVANATTVEVQFNRGQWRSAEVIGTDAYSDLAVLRVQRVPGYVESLSVANDSAEQGEAVAALGNPLGLQGSVTEGIVSGLNRSLPTQQGFFIPNVIQTDAAINPGNSGGPLVNCDGAITGVNTAGISGGENLGFAIPASVVRQVVPSLVENGTYRHSYLGIESVGVSPIVARANGLQQAQGVLVANVVSNSPANGVLQGSQRTERVRGFPVPVGGDIIVGIDGYRVRSSEDLSSYLATETRPGETVELTVIRNGERQTVNVTLGARPQP